MRERAVQILRIACLVLAALLLYQLVRTAFRVNPLSHVTIPALPKLASDTNAPPAIGTETNSVSAQGKGTNASPSVSGTNDVTAKASKETGTNLVAGAATKQNATNIASPLTPALSPSAGARENATTRSDESRAATNSQVQAASGQEAEMTETNSASTTSAANATNALPSVSTTNSSPSTTLPDTNIAVSVSPAGTNVTSSETNLSVGGTNVTASGTNTSPIITVTGTNAAGTNSARAKSKGTNSTPSKTSMAGMNLNPSQMRGGGKPSELPPEIKARVDRIYESEIFGQIMRPLPMALMGIAGDSAFLRSPSGQTGLVKEGDSLGEIKLLRIGINRVLVEQDGQKKELTIFDGFGSETLLPKEKETPK